MKLVNKSKKYLILFGITIGVTITIVVSLFFEYKKIFSIFYTYSKDTNIDKSFVNKYSIEGGPKSSISGVLNVLDDSILRLEFPYTLIENKIISISLKGTGTIQGYFISDKPIINCNSRIINERGKCNNSYWIFDRVKNIYGLLQKTRIVRQTIVDLNNNNQLFLENNNILSTINLVLGEYGDLSISSFIYLHMKENTNMDYFFPTITNPRGYSTVYLNPTKDNNIVFKPYDLGVDIDKVGYIISLSGGTEIIYKFIENPLSKKDNEWFDK